MSGQTSQSGSTSRDEWSEDLARLLLSGDAELGACSTTGAVISAIERGGNSANVVSSDIFHEQAINRAGSVPWHRAASKRWHALPLEHRRTLAAHYLLTGSATASVRGKFGLLAGVVIEQWLAEGAARRVQAAETGRNNAADKLERVYDEIAQWEARLARTQASDGTLPACALPRTAPPTRMVPESAFRARAAAHTATRALRALRSARDATLAQHATPLVSGSPEADLVALDSLCKSREVKVEFEERARASVRDAHRAWNETAPVRQKRTKTEERRERVADWLKQEGLA